MGLGLAIRKPFPHQTSGPLSRRMFTPKIAPAAVTSSAPVPRAVTSTAPQTIMPPKAAFTSFYAPSRIIDRSQIKIVESIAGERAKQFAEERGDLVNNQISTTRMSVPDDSIEYVEDSETPPIDGKKLLASLVAAYFLFS